MKKTFLLFLVSGCSLFASAQSFDIGLKGGLASTTLLNSNVNNGAIQNYVTAFTGDFGLHLQYNFAGTTGIEVEFISETFQDKRQGTFKDSGYTNNNGQETPYMRGESYTSTTSFTEMKIPVLFHYQAPSGFTFEIGPEFGMISNAKFAINYTNEPPAFIGGIASNSYSAQTDFASSNIMGVLGLGWNIKLSGQFYMITDLRFEYGLTDIKGLDAFGQNMALASASAPGYYSYSGSAATNTAEVSFNIGVFYRIPVGAGSGSTK